MKHMCMYIYIYTSVLCIAFPLQQKQSRSQRVAVFQARVLKMAALYDLEMTFQVPAGKTVGRNPNHQFIDGKHPIIIPLFTVMCVKNCKDDIDDRW